MIFRCLNPHFPDEDSEESKDTLIPKVTFS